MKHLKLYENKFNVNSLKKFAEEKDELYSLIREYSVINNIYDFDDDSHVVVDFYFEDDSENNNNEIIIVSTFDNDIPMSKQRDDLYYLIDDLDDINRFIENPETYNTSNKFNL